MKGAKMQYKGKKMMEPMMTDAVKPSKSKKSAPKKAVKKPVKKSGRSR